MEIADTLHELGDSGGALAALRESLELRRKLTEAEKDNLKTYLGHGYHFNGGGKLLTRMKRFDEALAAYREAEQAFQKVLEGEPKHITNRRFLTTLYLRMGDFHAGLGVCDFGRSQNYSGVGSSEYCPPDVIESTANSVRLRRALDYYQKAVSVLTEFEVQSVAEYADKENLLLGKQKIEAVAKNLSAGSR